VSRRCSQPLVGLPSQFPQPASQLAMPQLPPMQVPVACAGAQASLHPPQCTRLRSVSTQLLPQSESTAPHTDWHIRAPPESSLHTGVLPLQTLPQAPQSDASSRPCSQPFASLPSQSA